MEDSSLPPYYFSVRNDMVQFVPQDTKRILEVGCAGGATGKELRQRGIDEIIGVEVVEEIARSARPYYDALHVGDVETLDLPYEDGHFDCILYPDVLEHLKDPWNLLIRHNRLLKNEGLIIVSIPNIRHYRIVKKLALKGKWEYSDDGIMDRTHLRFFTLESIRSMIGNAGFDIQTIVKKPSGAGWLKGLNRLSGNRLIEFLVRQYVVSARKQREVS
ncbi:MAG: class I SAM-dependent methyltransferase [Syntrophorhabdaceae bacterium]